MGPMRGWRFRLLQVMWGVAEEKRLHGFLILESEKEGGSPISEMRFDRPIHTAFNFWYRNIRFHEHFCLFSPRKMFSVARHFCGHRVPCRHRYTRSFL